MSQTLVGYCICDTMLSGPETAAALRELPESLREHILLYTMQQDRNVRIYSWLLLRHMLTEYFGLPGNPLANLTRSKENRPFLPGDIDFSISHSGRVAVCGVTNCGRIGIDVEEIRHLEVADYTEHLQADEYDAVRSATDPSLAMLHVWTRKEAVLKASGAGVLYPMCKVNQSTSPVTLDPWSFWLYDSCSIADHVCAVAKSDADGISRFFAVGTEELRVPLQ
jgi:4'-phosphopantetheinyl transferase